jgi:hypothetical protein
MRWLWPGCGQGRLTPPLHVLHLPCESNFLCCALVSSNVLDMPKPSPISRPTSLLKGRSSGLFAPQHSRPELELHCKHAGALPAPKDDVAL